MLKLYMIRYLLVGASSLTLMFLSYAVASAPSRLASRLGMRGANLAACAGEQPGLGAYRANGAVAGRPPQWTHGRKHARDGRLPDRSGWRLPRADRGGVRCRERAEQLRRRRRGRFVRLHIRKYTAFL